jgi:dihydroorotate dehydrogenase (NAD+) catalytic subunit
MIYLSNGHKIEHMVASGALAFDGKGWFWERILVWLGLIKPELFTVVIKTLTLEPTKGNLCWWKPWTWLPFSPWSCIRPIPGGAVNKVGLTNKGIDWWCEEVAPKIDFKKYFVAGSILGNKEKLVKMARKLNMFPLVALEVNYSCPNTGHALNQSDAVIESVKAVKEVSRHPIIVKVSVDQDYLAIAEGLEGIAEAISLNSVPWKTAFPNGEVTPLRKLEKRLGGGGGGVSGRPAQEQNWKAVKLLKMDHCLPIIAPSIMDYDDLQFLKSEVCPDAYSFGAIHLRTPWRPTQIVQKETKQLRLAIKNFAKG